MVKINKPAIEVEQEKKRRMGWKLKLILFLLITLILVAAGFFAYYTYTQDTFERAKANNARIKLLDDQIAQCNQTISQGEGAFAQYEYCSQLLKTFK